MFYVMYKNRLDSMFFNLKAAEKYINQQKESYKYFVVEEVLSI